MNDELTARQRAISLRLAGRSVKQICSTLGRGETWFRKWWHRYLEAGPEGLYDLTRANHHVAQRIPPELERAILSIRRREAKRQPCGIGREAGCEPMYGRSPAPPNRRVLQMSFDGHDRPGTTSVSSRDHVSPYWFIRGATPHSLIRRR